MCNPFKAVKKIFKKVVKHLKVIVPVVLAAAAIYFTVGAAAGVAGSASGWLQSTLGLSGTLGSVISNGVIQAGYGAILGAGAAALTGSDISKGALFGAGAGAITGGITGFAAPSTLGAAGASGLSGSAPSSLSATAGGGLSGGGLLSNLGSGVSNVGSSIGGFITSNPEVSGQIFSGALQGIGSGLQGLAQAEGEVEAAKVLADSRVAEQDRIAGNFAVREGLLIGGGSGNLDETPRESPADRFGPGAFQQTQAAQEEETKASGTQPRMLRYNPETGQLEFAPVNRVA